MSSLVATGHLCRVFLQCLSDSRTNERTTGFAHGFDGVVIAGIQAHGQRGLTQWFLPRRNAVLVLSEVFY